MNQVCTTISGYARYKAVGALCQGGQEHERRVAICFSIRRLALVSLALEICENTSHGRAQPLHILIPQVTMASDPYGQGKRAKLTIGLGRNSVLHDVSPRGAPSTAKTRH